MRGHGGVGGGEGDGRDAVAVGEHFLGDVGHEFGFEYYCGEGGVSLGGFWGGGGGGGWGKRRDIGGGGEGYEEGKRRDVRPGWSENARTPLLPSFSARAVAKRMLAVLDCEYAVQGLYSAPS